MIRSRRFLGSALLLVTALPLLAADGGELDFLKDLSLSKRLPEMLDDSLEAQALRALERRQLAVAKIATRADLERRKKEVRAQILESIGGLPLKTPLNAKVVGTIDEGSYRIEKVIFESQPTLYVTANLYVPKGNGPFPAVLFPLGHESGGKANPAWQRVLRNLAMQGYVALTWDPISQGERVQLWDADFDTSKLNSSTTEHTIIHTQSLLLGQTVSRYTIADGVRALDYLLSRPEVDPKRVAVTGNSGGGTHSSYLAAIDDRIAVAAPSCYITSWKAMLESIGPQDGEQIFPGWFAGGFDYPDFLYAASPKPFLIMSAIRDFFPIAGARATYQEVAATYQRLEMSDRVKMFDSDDGHGYLQPRRKAAFEFLAAHLKPSGTPEDREVRIASVNELKCTSTGQLATSLQGEDAFSLNRKTAETFAAKRAPITAQRVREMLHVAGASRPAAIAKYGTLRRDGYRVERFTLQSDAGIVLPALLFMPESGAEKKPVVLYADGAGKSARADFSDLLKHGTAVLSIDLRGFGETAPPRQGDWATRYFGNYRSAQIAFMLNQSLVGLRVQDLKAAVDYLVSRTDVDGKAIHGWARGAAAVPMLHAAALDPRIADLTLEGGLISYQSALTQRLSMQVFEQIVPAVLTAYDLPDLAALMGSRPLWIVKARNALNRTVPDAEIAPAYAKAKNVIAGCSAGHGSMAIPDRVACSVDEPVEQ